MSSELFKEKKPDISTRIKRELEDVMRPGAAYNMHIEDSEIICTPGFKVVLFVQNEISKILIEKSWMNVIQKTLDKVLGEGHSFEIKVVPKQTSIEDQLNKK